MRSVMDLEERAYIEPFRVDGETRIIWRYERNMSEKTIQA
jgi:uncharacterized membrane protein